MTVEKRELRRQRWRALQEARAARFPGAAGRIPNFTGAEAAAERLAGLREWSRARVLKVNPDLPQRPVRHRALREGKVVYVAAPRLASERPFVRLDPEELGEADLWRASSIGGALELGRPVQLDEVERIDLVVLGCVAVSSDGARLGKGGGYADLELALLRETGRVGPRTPVATTAHPTQVLRRGRIPMEPHDAPVDLVATPARVIRCERRHRRPSRVRWELLEDERIEAMPVLTRARKGRKSR